MSLDRKVVAYMQHSAILNIVVSCCFGFRFRQSAAASFPQPSEGSFPQPSDCGFHRPSEGIPSGFPGSSMQPQSPASPSRGPTTVRRHNGPIVSLCIMVALLTYCCFLSRLTCCCFQGSQATTDNAKLPKVHTLPCSL